MDINFLLKREQIALMLGKAAKTLEARNDYERLARFYGERLKESAFPKVAINGPPRASLNASEQYAPTAMGSHSSRRIPRVHASGNSIRLSASGTLHDSGTAALA